MPILRQIKSIMQRIVIYQPNCPITGNFFYLEEIAQYVMDIGLSVVVLNHSGVNRNNLLDRYARNALEMCCFEKDDVVITSHQGIAFLLKNIDKIDKIFIINSANTHLLYTNNTLNSKHVSKLLQNKNKFYLCYQSNFETESINFELFRDRTIKIKRGFYFNNYITRQPNTNNSAYLLYSNYPGNAIDIYSDTMAITAAKDYCCHSNIEYDVIDGNFSNYNPAATYSGLLYVRKKDYMPRLPYEFWHYNKPVIFFDVSDGIRNMGIDVELKKPIIVNTNNSKYQMNLDNLLRLIR